jgi:voltage-gated sodium channel
VIIANSIYIGFETQRRVVDNIQDSWTVAVDAAFAAIYLVELILRYYARGFCTAMRCPWVQFDFFLVVTALLELCAAVTPDFDLGFLKKVMVVRLLRLLKLARMLRLMSQFKTLWLLVHGLINSFLTIVWTLVLLGIMVYLFAVLALETIKLDGEKSEYYNAVVQDNFGDFFKAAMTLFQFVTLDSVGAIYRPLLLEQPVLIFYFLAFVVIVSISLMNLVTAMMVECALDQSHEDKEVKKAYAMEKKKKKLEELRELFFQLDTDMSGRISLEELENASEDVRYHLQEVAGTDNFNELFKCLDHGRQDEIGIDTFCDGIDKSNAGKLEIHLLMCQMNRLHATNEKMLMSVSQLAYDYAVHVEL